MKYLLSYVLIFHKEIIYIAG